MLLRVAELSDVRGRYYIPALGGFELGDILSLIQQEKYFVLRARIKPEETYPCLRPSRDRTYLAVACVWFTSIISVLNPQKPFNHLLCERRPG